MADYGGGAMPSWSESVGPDPFRSTVEARCRRAMVDWSAMLASISGIVGTGCAVRIGIESAMGGGGGGALEGGAPFYEHYPPCMAFWWASRTRTQVLRSLKAVSAYVRRRGGPVRREGWLRMSGVFESIVGTESRFALPRCRL